MVVLHVRARLQLAAQIVRLPQFIQQPESVYTPNPSHPRFRTLRLVTSPLRTFSGPHLKSKLPFCVGGRACRGWNPGHPSLMLVPFSNLRHGVTSSPGCYRTRLGSYCLSLSILRWPVCATMPCFAVSPARLIFATPHSCLTEFTPRALCHHSQALGHTLGPAQKVPRVQRSWDWISFQMC